MNPLNMEISWELEQSTYHHHTQFITKSHHYFYFDSHFSKVSFFLDNQLLIYI